jgi:hypothetical protein
MATGLTRGGVGGRRESIDGPAVEASCGRDACWWEVRGYLARRSSNFSNDLRGFEPRNTRHGVWQPSIGLNNLASLRTALPN